MWRPVGKAARELERAIVPCPIERPSYQLCQENKKNKGLGGNGIHCQRDLGAWTAHRGPKSHEIDVCLSQKIHQTMQWHHMFECTLPVDDWSFSTPSTITMSSVEFCNATALFEVLLETNKHDMNSMQTCNSVTFYFMKKLIF